MISHNTSISSFGNRNTLNKEKDYEYLHYFDDQSDNEIEPDNSQNKMAQNKISQIKETKKFDSDNFYSSSDEENFFSYDEDSISDSNEKVIEKSPDGNFGKVI
jgi:hypothetical protein